MFKFNIKKIIILVLTEVILVCILLSSCATPPSKIKTNINSVTQKYALALNSSSEESSSVSVVSSALSSQPNSISSESSSSVVPLNMKPQDIANILISKEIPIDSNSLQLSKSLNNECLVSIDFSNENIKFTDSSTGNISILSGYIGQWPDDQSVQKDITELKGMGVKYYYQNGLDILVLAQCVDQNTADQFKTAFMSLTN